VQSYNCIEAGELIFPIGENPGTLLLSNSGHSVTDCHHLAGKGLSAVAVKHNFDPSVGTKQQVQARACHSYQLQCQNMAVSSQISREGICVR